MLLIYYIVISFYKNVYIEKKNFFKIKFKIYIKNLIFSKKSNLNFLQYTIF